MRKRLLASTLELALAQTWAMANGVSDGTNPNSAITRAQVAAMLMRYCENVAK